MNDNWRQSPDKNRPMTKWSRAFAGAVILAIGLSILVFVLSSTWTLGSTWTLCSNWALGSTRTYVAVTNNTSLPMQNLSIMVAGSEIWSGTLEAGGTIALANSPAHDGSVSVHATWDGRDMGLLDCGYVTPNLGMVYDLTLEPGGTWNSSIESPNLISMLQRQVMQWKYGPSFQKLSQPD